MTRLGNFERKEEVEGSDSWPNTGHFVFLVFWAEEGETGQIPRKVCGKGRRNETARHG